MNNKQIFWKILKYFWGWRILLFVVAYLATVLIVNFGNRFPYSDRVLTVTGLPNWVWGFGNFDGVHYLGIAQNGYLAEYTQAFFPLYPVIIRILNFFPKGNLDLNLYTDPSYFYTGLILSVTFFISALYFVYKLWEEQYGKKTASLAILLLLSFPTAFYFGAIYSEALFLLLAVLVFWFSKKEKYLLAGVFAALASATKILGVLLFVFLAIEVWSKYKGKLKNITAKFWWDFIGVLISPLGIIGYMYYLYRAFDNPIYFMTAQSGFGTGKANVPVVLLPQVIYRYIRILLSVTPSSIAFWNASLELGITLVLIVGIIWSFRKIKFSYWLFVTLAVLLPTLSGTLTSMPRYVLLAFPLFPLIAKFNKASKYIILAQIALQVILLTMFIRGYWVA
ncbi:MAG: mannosyltransferase family protein [Patescibacteria group bacterium]